MKAPCLKRISSKRPKWWRKYKEHPDKYHTIYWCPGKILGLGVHYTWICITTLPKLVVWLRQIIWPLCDLGELFHLSKPQFPRLKNGDNNTYLSGSMCEFNEIIYESQKHVCSFQLNDECLVSVLFSFPWKQNCWFCLGSNIRIKNLLSENLRIMNFYRSCSLHTIGLCS